MLAQKENVFKEAYNMVFRLNQNEKVRYMCEMREEGERIMNTYKERALKSEKKLARSVAALAEKDIELAKQQAIIERLQAELREYKGQ